MENGLRTRREAADLSQGELAEAVGVARRTINVIERGWYDSSLELAFKLAAYSDYRVENLFDPEFDTGLTT